MADGHLLGSYKEFMTVDPTEALKDASNRHDIIMTKRAHLDTTHVLATKMESTQTQSPSLTAALIRGSPKVSNNT